MCSAVGTCPTLARRSPVAARSRVTLSGTLAQQRAGLRADPLLNATRKPDPAHRAGGTACAMPLYDMLAIVKARVPVAQVGQIMKRAAASVYDAGGVLTDVRSFGVNKLAYEIRKAGELHQEARARRPRGRWRSCGSWCRPTRRRRLCRRADAPPRRVGTQGHYVQLTFMVPPTALAALEHDLRVDERVVRHIFVKKPALERLPRHKELVQLEKDMCVRRRARAPRAAPRSPARACGLGQPPSACPARCSGCPPRDGSVAALLASLAAPLGCGGAR